MSVMTPTLIQRYVSTVAETLGGEFRVTRTGVPHILFQGRHFRISVVYVARQDKWKAFYPWPSETQERIYFQNFKEMVEWLDKQGTLHV